MINLENEYVKTVITMYILGIPLSCIGHIQHIQHFDNPNKLTINQRAWITLFWPIAFIYIVFFIGIPFGIKFMFKGITDTFYKSSVVKDLPKSDVNLLLAKQELEDYLKKEQ